MVDEVSEELAITVAGVLVCFFAALVFTVH